MYNQFDIVQIITTKRIKFLSGPKGRSVSPHGNWSIVGFIKAEAIIAKQNTIVKIPVTDIRRTQIYNLKHVWERLKQAGKPRNKIDVVKEIQKTRGISETAAKDYAIKHNIPIIVETQQELQRALSLHSKGK